MLEIMSPEEVPRAFGPTIINAIISASLLTIVCYAWSKKYYHALMLTGTICIVVVLLFVLMKTLKQIDPDGLRSPDASNKSGTQRKRRSKPSKHQRPKPQATPTPVTPTPLPSAMPTPEQAPLPARPSSTPQPSEKPTPLPAQGVITTPPPASPTPAVPSGRGERKYEEKDN